MIVRGGIDQVAEFLLRAPMSGGTLARVFICDRLQTRDGILDCLFEVVQKLLIAAVFRNVGNRFRHGPRTFVADL